MADIKTMDDKIRAKALFELKEAIRQDFKSANDAYKRCGKYIATEARNKDGNYLSVDALLNIARDAIVNFHKDDVENKAVEAFMDKVDSLGEQIEELQSQIHDR